MPKISELDNMLKVRGFETSLPVRRIKGGHDAGYSLSLRRLEYERKRN